MGLPEYDHFSNDPWTACGLNEEGLTKLVKHFSEMIIHYQGSISHVVQALEKQALPDTLTIRAVCYLMVVGLLSAGAMLTTKQKRELAIVADLAREIDGAFQKARQQLGEEVTDMAEKDGVPENAQGNSLDDERTDMGEGLLL